MNTKKTQIEVRTLPKAVARRMLSFLLIPVFLLTAGCQTEEQKRQEEADRAAAVEEIMQDLTESRYEECKNRGYSGYWEDVCFRFMDKSDPNYSCDYSRGSCSVLEVSPVSGCKSIYVQANIEDSSGNILNWTNGTANSVPAEGNAIIKLTTFEKNASRIQITEINCR